ncbi:MAG: hypothetical protein AzoDbin1_05199 [Azoarcus sp.]|nr:hypothetical protein [Azoarcus sp.]
MKQRVQQAREMGLDPTLGQVGGTTATGALEKVARGTSAGQERAGRIKDTIENRVMAIAKTTGSDLTPQQAIKSVKGVWNATNPDTAGRVLQKSLGKEWLDRVKPVEDAVWGKWEGKANSKPAAMPNTIEFLNRRLEPIPGAEASSAGVLDNRALRNIHHNMIVDMDSSGAQAMPYEYLKATRSWIGDSLDPKRLTADTSIKDLNALYAAMSQDMEAHAKSIGPDAVRDFKRANALTKAKMGRVETYLQKIQGKEPGEVWRYASSPDAVEGGGHRFLTLNRSLAPDERPMFHSTFINEMGRKPNGEFDPLQFSENYKRLSPGVRDVLFPGVKGEAIDKVVKFTDINAMAHKPSGEFDPVQFSEQYKRLSPEARNALFSGAQGEAAAKAVNFIDQLNAQGTFSKGGMNLPQNLAGYLLMSSIMHASPGKLAKGLVGLSKMESVVNFMSKPWVINFVANENRLPPAFVARIFYAARQAMETQKRMEKQQKEGGDQDYMAVLQQAAQRYGAGQGVPGAMPGGAPAADSYDAVLQGVMQGGGGYEGGGEGDDE